VYRYRAYGLTISSDAEIPELPFAEPAASSAAPTISIRLERVSRQAIDPERWESRGVWPDGQQWLLAGRVRDGFIVRFVDMAEFFVGANGGRIELLWTVPGISPATVRHLLIDNIIPRALSLMGVHAIHATAVETVAGVCAFTGPSGAGKSTIAAAMARAGCPVFADDCLVFDHTCASIQVVPAYPGVRLWSDSAASFEREPAAARVADYTEKLRLSAGRSHDDFPSEARPLARIYRLARVGDGETTEDVSRPSIEPLSETEAFQELIAAIFRMETDNPSLLRREFMALSEVARRVSMRRLRVPNDMAMLPDVCAAVLQDVVAEAASN
jgi:energy-coupling factor transporter ATP-binding protein EcfA2